MVDLYLNYDRLMETCKKYFEIKSKKDGWAQSNLNLKNMIDKTNFGSWRDMFDTKTLSLNADYATFAIKLGVMCDTLTEESELACKLLNRAYDFYDILDGNQPMSDYPATLCAGNGKDLFYSSDYYSTIVETCEYVEYYDENENAALDEIDDLASGFQWFSPSELTGEVDAVRKDIEPQKYLAIFKESFIKYASEVSSFNETIGSSFDTVVEDVESIKQVPREYSLDNLPMGDEEKALLWFAQYIDPRDKSNYVDHPNFIKYAVEVYHTYCNASGTAKDVFDQYCGNIRIKTMDVLGNNASYHCNGKLYINGTTNVSSPKGEGCTFYHETGHFIVYATNARKSPEMDAFDKALKAGVQNYIDTIELDIRTNNPQKPNMSDEAYEQFVHDKVQQKIEVDLQTASGGDYAKIDGLTDMIDAQTNHEYHKESLWYTHYGNDTWYGTYWENDRNRQCDEAFAEMFAADMMGDQNELDYIKKYFGEDVYNAYQDVLKYMYNEGLK